MGSTFAFMLTAVFFVLALGGVVLAFSGASSETSKKRLAAAVGQPLSGPVARSLAEDGQRRKNVQSLLKEF